MKLTQRGLLQWMILLLSMLIIMLFFFGPGAYQPSAPGAVSGLQAEPEGGHFVLQGADGEVDTRRFSDKVAVLYFGYSQCPDICPTSLVVMATALNALTPDELAQVQPIFISVDPARDSVEHLKAYVGYFHPSLLGLTGNPETIAQVASQYGAAFRLADSDSAMGYLVDHSSVFYVNDRSGKLAASLAHGATAEDLVNAIRGQLSES